MAEKKEGEKVIYPSTLKYLGRQCRMQGSIVSPTAVIVESVTTRDIASSVTLVDGTVDVRTS